MLIKINNELNGLRGLAAFSVVISHFVQAFLPSVMYKNYPTDFVKSDEINIWEQILSSPFATIFYNGHFAVMIFFILSGCVLTIPYFQDKKNYQTILKNRIYARYLRINIPIIFASILSFLLLKFGFYFNDQVANLNHNFWFTKFLPGDFTFWQFLKEASYSSILFGSNSLAPQFWTLKVEFIGSIYLLIFFLIIKKDLNIYLYPFFYLLPLGLISLFHGNDILYYVAIFLGSILHKIKIDKKYNFLIFTIGIYFGAFQFYSIFYDYLPHIKNDPTYVKTFYNIIGAFLVLLAIYNGMAKDFLNGKIAQFFGKISLSLYVTHFAIVASISSFIYLKIGNSFFSLLLNFIIYLVATIYLAVIFEKFIDRNAILLSNKFKKKFYN